MEQLKQKRLEILDEINSIIKKCDCKIYRSDTNCQNCIRLQSLGQQLIDLSKQRRELKKGVIVDAR